MHWIRVEWGERDIVSPEVRPREQRETEGP